MTGRQRKDEEVRKKWQIIYRKWVARRDGNKNGTEKEKKRKKAWLEDDVLRGSVCVRGKKRKKRGGIVEIEEKREERRFLK